MHLTKPIKQSHLQVKTDLNAVTEVVEWFEKTSLPLLPQPFGSQCQLALVEGFTNAVRHAHQHLSPATLIEVEVTVFPDCLEMRIWDWGQPFDFQTKLKEALDHHKHCDPLEQEGGRGLIFMHQLTDELSYERLSDDRNCLLMRKHL